MKEKQMNKATEGTDSQYSESKFTRLPTTGRLGETLLMMEARDIEYEEKA